MTQTEANYLYYKKNENILVVGLTSGHTTVVGFKIGDGLTGSLQKPIFSPIGSVIWGNAAGASTTGA